MMNYKACPLKKRPVVYDAPAPVALVVVDQPQDLSLKREADDDLYRSSKRTNYGLDLSSSSSSSRPDSPISSDSSVSPRTEIEYPSIHLRGLSQWDINSYWSPAYPAQYQLTPPSSPGSASEPEDLSVKNYIPLPALFHGFPMPYEKKFATSQKPMTSSSSSAMKSCPRFRCEQCGKSYSTSTGLSKHQQFHCPAAECNRVKKTYACQTCDRSYTSMGALKMHIRTHTLPCKCPICGKAFSRPWLLQGHIRTHTGEKPFSCNQCDRAFADRSNLRAHQQTHFEVKKYACELCHKSFSRMSLLSKHHASGCNCTSSVESF